MKKKEISERELERKRVIDVDDRCREKEIVEESLK